MPLKRRRTISVPYVLQEVYENGGLVWAKYFHSWWSAIVVASSSSDKNILEGNYRVFWFGDHYTSEISASAIIDFKQNFEVIVLAKNGRVSKMWQKGVIEALQELYQQDEKFTFEGIRDLAYNGLPEVADRVNKIPEWVINILNNAERQSIDEGTVEEHDTKKTCSSVIKEKINAAIASKRPITKICLGCYASKSISSQHPLIQGGLCKECSERIRDTLYIKGDDGICYYCAICGFPGELIICEDTICGRVYCKRCITDLAAPNAWEEYIADENWTCFLCRQEANLSGAILRQDDYLDRIQKLYISDGPQLVSLPKVLAPGTKLRVLSLFDGIATGLKVLDNLGIAVEKYYSCEVDLDSINITKMNFGSRIDELGDIKNLNEECVRKISPIHLVLGGSPCNELSLANPCRKGLYDISGSGQLFFEFYRIISLLKKYNPGFYWIFENVASMPLRFKATITRFLQCQPALVDAARVSPQCRPRLFWGNIPYLHQNISVVTTDLQSYLMKDRTALIDCIRTVTTRSNSLKQGADLYCPIVDSNGKPDILWITELENVFGFPLHYTDTGNLSVAQRQQALGRAWSVQVMTLLLRFLKDFYG